MGVREGMGAIVARVAEALLVGSKKCVITVPEVSGVAATASDEAIGQICPTRHRPVHLDQFRVRHWAAGGVAFQAIGDFCLAGRRYNGAACMRIAMSIILSRDRTQCKHPNKQAGRAK